MDHEGRLNMLESQIMEINRNLLVASNRHNELALQVTTIETRIDTAVSITKWVVTLVGIDLLINILKITNVIN